MRGFGSNESERATQASAGARRFWRSGLFAALAGGLCLVALGPAGCNLDLNGQPEEPLGSSSLAPGAQPNGAAPASPESPAFGGVDDGTNPDAAPTGTPAAGDPSTAPPPAVAPTDSTMGAAGAGGGMMSPDAPDAGVLAQQLDADAGMDGP